MKERGWRVFPERIDLLNIVSVSGYDRWIPRTAWKIHAGGAQARHLGCDGPSCAWGGIETAGGIALRFGRPLLLFLMTEVDLAGGAPLERHYRVGVGGLGGAVLRWGRFAQTELQGRYVWYLLGDRRRAPVVDVGQSIDFGTRAQLRLVGAAVGSYREARAEVLAYF
jgi:hypothetical protein